MTRPTLFRVLLQERHWDRWATFCAHFEQAARELAEESNCPRLADVTVAKRTFDRWTSPAWGGRPWPDTAHILEKLLGFPCAELFRPAPDVMSAKASVHDRGGLRASLLIGQRWPTSRLFVSGTDDVADVWELTGRSAMDGTTLAVQFHAASRADDLVQIHPSDPSVLDQFLRPARRGLLVGVDEGTEDLNLYVLDSSQARRTRAASRRDRPLVLPAAHLLDDLTYGLLWALVQFDDGLLADDRALAEERPALDTYLSLPRSAPSRMAAPDLTTVGSQWLGSAFCAEHVQRRLKGASQPPVFWTREQTGEQAAAWLFFQHKIDYLQTLSAQYARSASPLSRTFCIPEVEVTRSSRFERVLLFLAITLMETNRIQVQVTPDPDYSDTDGFALVPGQRAVVANWVRTPAIWSADTVTRRSTLREYHDAVSEARACSVMQGPNPESRLRALAGYLDIQWPWLVRRCHELGECGVASMVRPRSRHLSVTALDEVLRYLGAFHTAG